MNDTYYLLIVHVDETPDILTYRTTISTSHKEMMRSLAVDYSIAFQKAPTKIIKVVDGKHYEMSDQEVLNLITIELDKLQKEFYKNEYALVSAKTLLLQK